MGQDVAQSHFYKRDFTRFEKALRAETELLLKLCKEAEKSSDSDHTVGCELEIWLVDDDQRPACVSENLLSKLDNPSCTHELAQFQAEFNSPVHTLKGSVFSKMHQDLAEFYDEVVKTAKEECKAFPCLMGTLPTLRPEDLSLETMSNFHRYRALNEQLLRARHGKSLHLHIENNGDPAQSSLDLDHSNVMLEACCTSFQLHWQMPLEESARYYNAALIASPITVAISANSPTLFGKELWQETRIPVFEQTVAFSEPTSRAWLGTDYCHGNLADLFEENLEREVVLPIKLSDDINNMEHVRLHNGSLWRWLRPVVDVGSDDEPPVSLRMEHRCLPSGPTLIDTVANAAFYYGLVKHLTDQETPVEQKIRFESVLDNFYSAATDGLEANVVWLDRETTTVQQLIQTELLEAAAKGLRALQVDESDIEKYLGVIRLRVETGQTGAVWQRRWLKTNGHDFVALVAAYRRNQENGQPVANWDV